MALKIGNRIRAILFGMMKEDMTDSQQKKEELIMKNNLENHTDWIVLNYSMETLSEWSKEDEGLKDWIVPHLIRLEKEPRKAVAGRARKMLKMLSIEY